MANLNSGIYRIENLANRNVYIGSAVNVKRRWGEHTKTLRAGRHRNHHLQNAWTLYGEEAFAFDVLEWTDHERLIAREQFWIDATGAADTGYNINRTAGNRLGMHHSSESRDRIRQKKLGVKATQEAREHMSAAQIGRKATTETKAKLSALRIGFVYTREARIRMSKTRKNRKIGLGESNGRARLNELQVIEMRILYAMNCASTVVLGTVYGVNNTVAGDAVKHRTWNHVPDTFPPIKRGCK